MPITWEWVDIIRIAKRSDDGATSRFVAASAHNACVLDLPADLTESLSGDYMRVTLSTAEPQGPGDTDVVLRTIVVSHGVEGILLSAGGMILCIARRADAPSRSKARLPTPGTCVGEGCVVFVTVSPEDGKRVRDDQDARPPPRATRSRARVQQACK